MNYKIGDHVEFNKFTGEKLIGIITGYDPNDKTYFLNIDEDPSLDEGFSYRVPEKDIKKIIDDKYKFGDTIKVISINEQDSLLGRKIGDIGVILNYYPNKAFYEIYFDESSPDYLMHEAEIKLIKRRNLKDVIDALNVSYHPDLYNYKIVKEYFEEYLNKNNIIYNANEI